MKQKAAECATYETDGISKMAYEGDIVSRLRNWRGLHLSHGGQLFDEAANDIERLRITEEERVAIAWFSQLAYGEGGRVPDYAATLRRLLERMA